MTTLRSFKTLAAALVAAASLAAAPSAFAAGESVGVLDHDFSFEGPFGTFDQAQLQRGWQVYAEVCAGCHSMRYLAFRDLGREDGPAFPPEQVAAIAENFIHQVPTLDEFGSPSSRPAVPSDTIPLPWESEKAAEVTFGKVPPDLTNITNARYGFTGTFNQLINGGGGPEYVYSLLRGYVDPPPNFDVGVASYNRYMPGHVIAMAQPLWDDGVTYQDGTNATVAQQAADVSAFLAWAADPEMTERKASGMRNLLFMGLFAVLLWFSNRQLWAPIKKGGAA